VGSSQIRIRAGSPARNALALAARELVCTAPRIGCLRHAGLSAASPAAECSADCALQSSIKDHIARELG